MSYNSGAIDGLTADQNTQGGPLGPGWALSEGFIERQYKTCSSDGGAGADFCYAGDNATFSFGGLNSKLIFEGTEGSWATGWGNAYNYWLEDHSGWKVTRFINDVSTRVGLGVDNDREFWLATAPDGTQYWFGYGVETGSYPNYSPGTALGSVQTVPVVGNHAGEPCHNQSYNWCHQAYRWSLDRIEDPNGRVTTFHYFQDVNHYGIRGTPGWSEPYVAGSVLVRIEYGQLPTSASTPNWYTNSIDLVYHGRCINPDPDGWCRTPVTAANGGYFPDIPTDQFCPDSSCTHYAPTFYTTWMLGSVQTNVRNTSGVMETVDVWGMTFRWVDADGGGPDPQRLWLSRVDRAGVRAVTAGMTAALAVGAVDVEVVEIEARRHVEDRDAVVIPIGEHLSRFDRPTPSLTRYDTLLEA